MVDQPPRMCPKCGYTADAYSGLGGATVAKDGDISVCINCGALSARRGDTWEPLTRKEFLALPSPLRMKLRVTEAARRMTVTHDLTQRDGRT